MKNVGKLLNVVSCGEIEKNRKTLSFYFEFSVSFLKSENQTMRLDDELLCTSTSNYQVVNTVLCVNNKEVLNFPCDLAQLLNDPDPKIFCANKIATHKKPNATSGKISEE